MHIINDYAIEIQCVPAFLRVWRPLSRNDTSQKQKGFNCQFKVYRLRFGNDLFMYIADASICTYILVKSSSILQMHLYVHTYWWRALPQCTIIELGIAIGNPFLSNGTYHTLKKSSSYVYVCTYVYFYRCIWSILCIYAYVHRYRLICMRICDTSEYTFVCICIYTCTPISIYTVLVTLLQDIDSIFSFHS